MILEKKLEGKGVYLRTAEPADAKFILELRLNPNLNKFLKRTDPSIEKQEKWIEEKQKAAHDYHLIIAGTDDKRFGVIALYGIDQEKRTFDWGRWIIAEGTPFYVAIESAILLYKFAFYALDLEKALFEVRKGNEKVIAFHKRFGSSVRSEDDDFIYFSFDRESFARTLKRYRKYHENTVR